MRYNLWFVSKVYAKGFITFLNKNSISGNRVDVFNLFVYAIESIYFRKSSLGNTLINGYGFKCIKYLRSLDNVPRKIGKLSLKSRKYIVDSSKVYTLVAIQYFSGGCEVYESEESGSNN